MGPLDILNHLLNFLAPATVVAVLVAVFARFFLTNRGAALSIWMQCAINFVACCAALGFGLWFFGRDGKMVSYGAMLLCCASSQWLMGRLWKV